MKTSALKDLNNGLNSPVLSWVGGRRERTILVSAVKNNYKLKNQIEKISFLVKYTFLAVRR